MRILVNFCYESKSIQCHKVNRIIHHHLYQSNRKIIITVLPFQFHHITLTYPTHPHPLQLVYHLCLCQHQILLITNRSFIQPTLPWYPRTRTTVPTGTRSTTSLPCFPCLLLELPFAPGGALYTVAGKLKDCVSLHARITTLPPIPPLPPSKILFTGPSLRWLKQPLPPLLSCRYKRFAGIKGLEGEEYLVWDLPTSV